MAVTTTVQDILDGAYAKSSKNQPGTIANEAVELTGLVTRLLRGLYNFAAEVNPIHFAETADVVGVASVWERPESAEAIIRIENDVFAEVIVVPYDDRLCEEPKPTVYEFGGDFFAFAGQTAPPGATDTLTFWYSKRPDDPAPGGVAGVLDSDWQEDYDELLILEVAIFLALKDGRGDEAAALKQDRNAWAQRFASYLTHSTANLHRRFGHRRHINVNTLLPMLTGGA